MAGRQNCTRPSLLLLCRQSLLSRPRHFPRFATNLQPECSLIGTGMSWQTATIDFLPNVCYICTFDNSGISCHVTTSGFQFVRKIRKNACLNWCGVMHNGARFNGIPTIQVSPHLKICWKTWSFGPTMRSRN